MSKARIMVVEADTIATLSLQRKLENLGYEVSVAAASGKEIIAQAEQVEPDLVLPDVGLGDKIDGLATATQIRERFDIPVVYLTADANHSTLQRAGATKPFDYILKPFTDRELQIAIEIALYKHRLEKKLKESEERYRIVVETATDAIITIDKESKILFINPAAENLFGYTAAEMLERSLHILIPEYLRHVHQTAMNRYIDTGQKRITWQGVELPGLHKNGQEIPLEISFGEFARNGQHFFTGIIRDITQRKQIETEMQKLSNTLEQIADSVVITNREGIIEYVNSAFEQISGYTKEEALGQTPRLLKSNRHPQRFYKKLWETILRGQVFRATFINRRKNGQLYHDDRTITPLKDNRGNITHLVSTGRDITERKQVEETLKKLSGVVEQTADHVIITDKEGIIEYVNPSFEQLTGYTKEEVIGKTPRILKSGRHDQKFYKVLWSTILSGQVFRAVLVNQKKNGELFYEEGTITPLRDRWGNITHFVSTGKNITERVQAEEELKQYRDRLEELVEERTAELARSNQQLQEEIRERKQTEMALRESEHRYALAARGANDGLWDWDLTTNRIYFSPRWKAMLGHDEQKDLGHSPDAWFNRVHPEDREQLQREIGAHLGGVSPHLENECRMLHKDGSYRWMLYRGLAVRDPHGWSHRMAGSLTDITRRKMAEEQLRHDALHDALTNLPNRILFMDRLEETLERMKQDESYLFAVLFLDLDRFKIINDSLGHLIGDQLLIAIARALEASVRSDDTVARLGGDEFAILLDQVQDVDEVEYIANRIQDELALPIILDGHEVFAAASIGITMDMRNYERPEEILRDADTAMYQAKARGRARYELFEADQHTRAVARWQLETDLRQAIERQEFKVHYQPIVSLANGRIIGVEALLRWQHPQRGLLGPGEFLPLAEETGLIVPIGEWLLRTTCAQTRAWRQAGHGSLPVAINMSARQLQQQNVVALIKEVLAQNGLPPHALTLEIAERLGLQNIDLTILDELKALGLKLSIDDFGIGSSLECLKQLPLDTLKIAQSFVRGMTSEVNDRAIITAMIAMAHSFNLKVIAEGVETGEHLAFLRSQQCDAIQGYLFSPPVPPEELTKLLQAKEIYHLEPSGMEKELNLLMRAQTTQNVGYALVDEQLSILAGNTVMNRWVEAEAGELVGRSLPEVFPELADVRESLCQIIRNQGEALTIPKIYRSSVDGFGRYFDLQAEPFLAAGAALLIMLTDVTEQVYLEFELRQERNELRLNVAKRKYTEEELEQYHDHLEELVQERTVELAKSNEQLQEEITRRKQVEETLRESEERYALAARGANDGLWDWNLQTNQIYFSPRWKSMLGYEEDEIGDSPDDWFNRVHPDDLGSLKTTIEAHLQQQTTHLEHKYRMLYQGSIYRWVLCRGLAVRDADGGSHRIAGSQTDITQRKRAEEQLLHDAFHDALTGLPNRPLFLDHLERSIGHAKRNENYLFAVLFLDLDRFKVVNDSLGHTAGNQLLMTIAHRLKAYIRPGDTVARLGGDEFAILLDDIKDVSEAMHIAGQVQNKVVTPIDLEQQEVVTTASIGIVLSKDTRLDYLYDQPEDILRDADTAMYQAKAQGRARAEVFDIGMHARAVALLELETELRRAIDQQELQVYYQPIVSVASGRISGVEALLRWQRSQHGFVTPAEFIPLAEETGLIVPLGEWLFHTTCAQTKAWHMAGHTALRLAINVSVRQFQEQDLPALIKKVLAETGLPAEALELEITESIAMQNIDLNLLTLNELSAMGVRISIDDFGTGYSSLDRLKRLPLQTLKIDQSFVRDMTSNADDAAIITAIIAMAHSLNLKVIAEGVEQEEQMAFLRAQQCDEIQGHLFSKPLPAEALTKLLQKGKG